MPFSLKAKMVAAAQGPRQPVFREPKKVSRVERNEAEILECKYTRGELENQLSGNYRFMFVVDYNNKDQANNAVKAVADSSPVWNPDKKLNSVKIQPTVTHAQACMAAVKPFMRDQTVQLTIPSSLNKAVPPTMDWVAFENTCVTGKCSGDPVSYKTGILCTGPTYYLKQMFRDAGWTMVYGINDSAAAGWIFDRCKGEYYPEATKRAVMDWCQPRGVQFTEHLDGFTDEPTHELPIDATEPRLVQELSSQDNLDAVSNAGSSSIKSPATVSVTRKRAR